MPTVLLNDRRVASLKPGKTRVDYFDRHLPSFGIRVQARTKTWFLMYRNTGDPKIRRMTLGQYPDISLSDARDAAGAEIRKRDKGRDPATERQQAKHRTFKALADVYLERHAKAHKRSWKEDERRLGKLNAEWGNRPVITIRRADVRTVLEAIADRAPVEANRTLALIRKVFNFGIGREWLEANPATLLERPGGADPTRDRVLSEAELRRLWKAWDALDPSMGAYFKLRLLTAQRGIEVASMRWQDVDLEAGWWTVPAEISKNKLAHRVPLTATAVTILHALPTAAAEKVARRKKKNGGSVPTLVLAGARGKRQQAEAAATFGVADFRGHDLRRTAASTMASGGISRLVISKLLNHVETGVTRVYDRHSYDAEKQAALTWWDAKLIAILENKSSKVLAFSKQA